MTNKAIVPCLVALVAVGCAGNGDGEIPVTTSSEEARGHYLEGREYLDKLRFTDARQFFEQAVEEDPGFALAHLALANTSTTAENFFDSLEQAVSKSAGISEGERLQILAADAAAKNDLAKQLEYLTKLVERYPGDARALTQLGTYYFGLQDYRAAIEQYTAATETNPKHSQAWNQLGYARRFLGEYPQAEEAFKKYIELIPDEPNPYDSYAELLMKMGRFAESNETYQQALNQTLNFVPSFIGGAHNHVFLGEIERGRQALERLFEIARNDGEHRQALLWTAACWLYDGDPAKALESVERMRAIAEESGDLAGVATDLDLMGDILLESGRAREAADRYETAISTMERADLPEEIKEAVRRDQIYNEARVALAGGDLDAARSKAEEFRLAVESEGIPQELRQSHELTGRIALAGKDHDRALSELAQANQQDPRVLYLTAVCLQEKGETDRAREAYQKVADFNEINFNYAYVRGKAQAVLGTEQERERPAFSLPRKERR